MFVDLGPGVRLCMWRSRWRHWSLSSRGAGGACGHRGQPAPTFSGKDSQGKAQSLAQYRGKYVVLEWTNRECPYTKKQYDSGNMQRLQREWTAKGVVWLTVLSSPQGEPGYLDAAQENAQIAKVHAHPTAAILDPSGTIGREYGAKTTPHMFVIDPARQADLRRRDR